LSEAEKEMRRDTQHRLLLELAVFRLVSQSDAPAAAVPAPTPAERPHAPVPTPAPFEPQPEPVSPTPVHAAPPTPPPDAAPAGEEVSLEQVLAAWPLVRESVRSVRLKGVLGSARPARLSGKELLLLVPPGHQFHLDQLEKPESIRLVQDAVQRALGVELIVRARMQDDAGKDQTEPNKPRRPQNTMNPESEPAAPAGTPPPATPPPADTMDPYDAGTVSVKDVVDLFGGRIVPQGGDT
ncbi:MAG: hypothetical protein QHJ73_11685, partial [Armatimonadota bacterium]|nr:hypothetical protein [Armatimonadota bacterium]